MLCPSACVCLHTDVRVNSTALADLDQVPDSARDGRSPMVCTTVRTEWEPVAAAIVDGEKEFAPPFRPLSGVVRFVAVLVGNRR